MTITSEIVKFWNFLSDLALLDWVITIMIIKLLTFAVYFNKYLKSQWRFGKNLKRKIYFLKTSESKTLQTQKDKLKSLGLFNLEEDIKNISNGLDGLQLLKKDAVYVVGYSAQYSYKELFAKIENNNIPIIIFANQGEIKEDWTLFNGYIYCDIANTTNRLAIILLNILKIV